MTRHISAATERERQATIHRVRSGDAPCTFCPLAITCLAALLWVVPRSAPVLAQVAEPQTGDPGETVSDADEDNHKPMEIGVRFTPKMAAAMSKKFIEQMKPRYELDEEQVEEISGAMQRQLLTFASDNAVLGRDMIELMMATMIENDGRFPKEEAQQFAKMANKFTPRLKEFVTHSSAELGKKMNMKQRLKFTGDVGLFAAGLLTFENRMKRWQEGKIGDNANPFFDPADKDPAKAEPEPVNPNEHREHRRARKDVEMWLGWQINKDERWSGYIDLAAKFYEFTDAQRTSAQAVLKDCQDRVKSIKTKEWRDAVSENRILRQLSLRAGGELSGGPWMATLEASYEKLLKPLNDLDAEFKRRIDDLPDSTQRAAARETVRRVLADKGVAQLPT